jgi:hypothetical protein
MSAVSSCVCDRPFGIDIVFRTHPYWIDDPSKCVLDASCIPNWTVDSWVSSGGRVKKGTLIAEAENNQSPITQQLSICSWQ